MLRRLLICSLALGASLSYARQGSEPYEGMNFQASIGSFKIPHSHGKVTVEFEGTLLLSEVKGTKQITGNLKLEYDNKKMGRQTYFGKGKVVVDGEWGAVQVFGKGIKGRFAGVGFVQLVAEFDKNLNTGTYYFDKTPDKLSPWYTTLVSVQMPPVRGGSDIAPRKRGGGG